MDTAKPTMSSTVTATSGMAFDAAIDGHTFPIDAAAEHGGADGGPRPKGLVLTALAGCAAMDVISILRKMRQPFTHLAVRADADLTDTHPKVFRDIVVTVEVDGEVDAAKLWRAVALSRDQYCGVAAMLKAHAPIAYRVRLGGREIPEPAPSS